MAALDILLSLLIPALVILHLVVAPYTKVEESFNIQATHDILVYGTPTSDVYNRLSAQYDHFDFPGAVPRTFVGPVLLAGIAQPVLALVGFQHAQFVVRAILGLVNAACLTAFQVGVRKAFGKTTARWYALLQASQFHVFFYASRTLPNMFAFGLTTLAFKQLLGHPTIGRCRVAIGLLTCATAVFRSELAILLGTTALYLLVVTQLPLRHIIPPFLVSFILSLAISVPLDSYFWQKPLWPELWGFYYNAVLGSSSEWGVSPWHYYFTNALPKLMINPLTWTLLAPLALATPATGREARLLALPTLLFVAIYSVQPHKEARFIFYAVPPLTAVAAMGANYIFTRRAKSFLYFVASMVLVLSVLVSFAGSFGMLLVSSLNYPGGEALSELRSLTTAGDSSDLQAAMVHTDVLSCMTGVTLFGQQAFQPGERRLSGDDGASFYFDKTEDPSTLRSPDFWAQFDYVLAEDPGKVIGSWETVGVVQGFAGVELLKPGMEPKGGSGSSSGDVESGESDRILGRGAVLRNIRDSVRAVTGGWWVGPRMEPRVRILRKLRDIPRKEVRE